MRTFIQFLTGLDSIRAGIPEGVSIFMAYNNLSAALWATETLTGLFRQLPHSPEPHLSPQCFSTLEDPRFRAHATAVAVQANLIVVSISSELNRLPDFVESWLEKCLAAKRDTHATVVALFGRPGFPDPADSPRFRSMRCLAEQTGCTLFAPWLADEALSFPTNGIARPALPGGSG
jgi:hypothetical protein